MTVNLDHAGIQYERQRHGARRRGIEWHFTFPEWLSVWEESGKWHERGRGLGKYVMARHGDVGPYAVGNVEIITSSQNTTDAHANGRFPLRESQTAGEFSFGAPPITASAEVVDSCPTYRDAVRTCWAHRGVSRMTHRTLASLMDVWPTHVSDWFNEDDAKTRRNLPAAHIADFEWICGNSIVTQWLSAQSAASAA